MPKDFTLKYLYTYYLLQYNRLKQVHKGYLEEKRRYWIEYAITEQ